MWEFVSLSQAFSKRTKPYINHAGFPNLCILPYVRGRLVFSELVGRAIEEEEFDLLVLDLPHFMKDKQCLDIPLRFFPLASSLIIQKDKSNFVLFPFVPNDAACIGAYIARRKFNGFFECVDDHIIDYPEGYLFQPEMALRDDYFVFSEGLKEYFTQVWDRMNSLWNEISYLQRSYTIYRASIVTRRLKECLARGGRTLFLCEYQLWWAVKKFLEDEESRFKLSSPLRLKEWKGACLVEDPYLLWARGLLDDYPAINYRFFLKLQEGKVQVFDKLKTLNETLANLTSPGKFMEVKNPSIRSLESFTCYLKSRVFPSGRIIPLPTAHLFDAARSCLGREVARELAKRLLRYPAPIIYRPNDLQPTFFTITPDSMVLEGEVFDLPDVLHSSLYWGSPMTSGQFYPSLEEEERKYWVEQVNPYITQQETKQMEEKGGAARWAIEADYRFHEVACSCAKKVVGKGVNRIRVERSWGTLGDGIHWKATIMAMAQGEKAIYIKRRISRKGEIKNFNEYTPIVFLFSDGIEGNGTSTIHDSNITQRHMELGDRGISYGSFPKPDMVHSVFLTSQKTENLWGHHVQREGLTSITFLYTRSLMGVKRYEAINRRSERFQCRVEPASDGELKEFPRSELGAAWAIKYAQEAVIVVAYPGWKPSGRLQQFAQKKRVQLITVPLSILSPGMIRRLRQIYFISTPLKRHPEREKIVKRFLQ
jgi:hypothetical protein